MPVTYSKDDQRAAKDKGWQLVTIAVPGLAWQGAVPPAEMFALSRYLEEFLERRAIAQQAAQKKAEGPSEL